MVGFGLGFQSLGDQTSPAAEPEGDCGSTVTAPLVGTFYRSPQPGPTPSWRWVTW